VDRCPVRLPRAVELVDAAHAAVGENQRPGLSGLCKVKLSLLLTLIGGVPRVDGSGAAHPSFARSAPRPAWLPSRKSNGGGCAR